MFLRLPVIRVLGLFSSDQKPSALDHLGRTPDHQGEIGSLAPQMSCCPSNPSSPFLIWGHAPASSLMTRGWSKRLEFAKSTNFPPRSNPSVSPHICIYVNNALHISVFKLRLRNGSLLQATQFLAARLLVKQGSFSCIESLQMGVEEALDSLL